MGATISKNEIKIFGSLGKKNNIYQTIITVGHTDEISGKIIKGKPKWKSTNLPVKNNLKKAEEILLHRQQEELEELLKSSNSSHIIAEGKTSICDFLLKCIDFKENREKGTKYYISYGTAKGYRSYVNNHFHPFFTEEKGITLETLTRDHVEAFYEDRMKQKTISANSVSKMHHLLSAAYVLAVKKYRLVKHNIMLEVEKPVFIIKSFSFFKPDEMQNYINLLCRSKSILFIPVLLASYYGLRRSEIIGLKWDALDFTQDTMMIFRKVVEGKDENGSRRYVLEHGTKNDVGARTHRIEPAVKEFLLKHYECQQQYKVFLWK